MEYWLPIVYFGIMGLALLIYVILDGYDLGVGILLPLANEPEKDRMIASIGPFWDANETWIVLGVGVLLIAFPKAYGLVLTALYLPVTLMLMGLILRGVAFDLRVKADDKHRVLWNRAFFSGSLIAATAQGWMLGAFVTGLNGGAIGTLFSILIALTLPTLYVLLGGGWLLMKAEGELLTKARRWSARALWPMGLGLFTVSIATPLVSDAIAEKWFSWPDLLWLAPIPAVCALSFFGLVYALRNRVLLDKRPWVVMVATILICLMAALGLAYSLFPDIVPGRITLWEAASATESLLFTLVGVVITLPAILFYTVYVYYVFHGRATDLSYE